MKKFILRQNGLKISILGKSNYIKTTFDQKISETHIFNDLGDFIGRQFASGEHAKCDLQVWGSYVVIAVEVVNFEGVKHLDVPRGLFAERWHQIEEVVESQVALAVPGEDFAYAPFEWIFLKLWWNFGKRPSCLW